MAKPKVKEERNWTSVKDLIDTLRAIPSKLRDDCTVRVYDFYSGELHRVESVDVVWRDDGRADVDLNITVIRYGDKVTKTT